MDKVAWPPVLGFRAEDVALRVHVPNHWVLRVLVIVIVVKVLGRYMIIRYLDPEGRVFTRHASSRALKGVEDEMGEWV